MKREKTGIIFDIDGTLWDSSEQVAESFQEMTRRHPEVDAACTREDFKRVMGKPMDEIAAILFPKLPTEERARFMTLCEEHEVAYLRAHPPKAFDGVEETLRSLAEDYPLYIVSNCQVGYIEAFLYVTGLEDVISDFVSFGDNLLPKGDNIRLIAERNGLERYYYLGDILSDYKATIAGGGRFIYAAYGFGDVKEDVPRIEDIRELPALMKTLEQ